jgi:hypothetical protein
MSRWKISAVAVFAATLALLPGRAVAQEATMSDPAGDTLARGLDVTRVKLANNDHSIVTTVRFVETRRDELIVFLDPRGRHPGVTMVSQYRPKGTTRNFVLSNAPSDERPRVRCPGFEVVWRPARDLARMTLPSTCLRHGDYGAVRFAFLTERDAADIDFSSEMSPFIPRG